MCGFSQGTTAGYSKLPSGLGECVVGLSMWLCDLLATGAGCIPALAHSQLGYAPVPATPKGIIGMDNGPLGNVILHNRPALIIEKLTLGTRGLVMHLRSSR